MTHISNPKHKPPVKSAREYEAEIRRLASIIVVAAEDAGRIAEDTHNPEVGELERFLIDEHLAFIERRPPQSARACNGTGQVAHTYGQRYCKGCANCGGGA